MIFLIFFFFFFKQKTAYEIVSGDWSSDVCSSDLFCAQQRRAAAHPRRGWRSRRRQRSRGRCRRSEEHTSELQSPDTISYAVFCLKKKNPPTKTTHHMTHVN